MADTAAIQDEIDVWGAFWRPEASGDIFTGHLVRSRHGIEFTRSPIYQSHVPFDSLAIGLKPEKIACLHGFTGNGPCTLLGLLSATEGGFTDFGADRRLAVRSFDVRLVLLGIHLPGTSAPVLNSVSLVYSGLREWTTIPLRMQSDEEGITVRIPNKPVQILNLYSPEAKAHVYLDVRAGFEQRFAEGIRSVPEHVVTIEPDEPQSLDWFIGAADRLENFFSLLVGTSVRLLRFSCTLGEATGWMIRKVRGRETKPQPNLWIRCTQAQLSNALIKWLSVPPRFIPFENLVFGTIRRSTLYVETEFLSLAQALESFHRITDSSTVIPAKQFKKTAKTLRRQIKESRNAPAINARLSECIVHANEPSFRMRIKALLSRLDPSRCDQLLGNVDEFEQTLRGTRNYFTHLGIAIKGKVLTDTTPLFVFNQKLHALIRWLVLIDLGFPEDIAFEVALNQSRRWQLV